MGAKRLRDPRLRIVVLAKSLWLHRVHVRVHVQVGAHFSPAKAEVKKNPLWWRNMRLLLWTLTLFFAARVAAQAWQRWAPLSFMPPFDAFQGSNLPYWLLLPVQLVILGAMAYVSWRVHAGRLAASRRLGIWLAWAGALYMAITIGRVAVGLLVPEAPPWFSTWIPAFFHVVLAGFVLAVSVYHLRKPPLR